MAIRQVKKELELPPAHLYLEEIESIVDNMISVAKREARPGTDEQPTVHFEVGKTRECDSIEDLKALGGTWRNFGIKVGRGRFKTTIYQTYVDGRDDAIANHVLQITIRRVNPLRALLRKVPMWAVLAWFYSLIALMGAASHTKFWFMGVVGLLLSSLIITGWAVSTYTIVELRYSHEPSPRWAALKSHGGKLTWVVIVGIISSAVTLLVQWLWKDLIKR
jgi:hypothetical protein